MYPIYKFCKEEYNISKNCSTIQLGTLQYYRELDPNFSITDALEGIYNAQTNGQPVIFENNEMSQTGIVKGNDLIGTIEIAENFNIISPNVYLFSATLNPENEFWKEYNSHYTIHNVESFCQLIVNLLSNNFSTNDLEDTNLSLIEMNNLRFACTYNKVEYIKKPIEFTNQNKIEIVTKINDPIQNIFIKSSNYSEENEFRIIFFLTDGKKIYSVKKDPKLINLNLYQEYIN